MTFRQTDPFYTLDLSDVKAPKQVGELQIDGFSRYLHPIDENYILGVGRDADSQGVQKGLMLELFDISDFANPKVADKVVIGDRYTYSEAEYNHKAFVYRSSDKLFGFNYINSWRDSSEAYYGVYEINASHEIQELQKFDGNPKRAIFFNSDEKRRALTMGYGKFYTKLIDGEK